jgi:hypothetical protein
MTKEFIPYELALKLKELGFDEPCLASWSSKTKERIPTLYGCGALLFDTDGLITNQTEDIICSAPIFSTVLKWFRNKYSLQCFIKNFKPNDAYPNGYYCISKPTKYYSSAITDWYFTNFKTYEEAELECLKKLIEIVKNK